MEALDEVRREIWREVHDKANRLVKEHPRGPGRPKKDDKEAAEIAAVKDKAEQIKNSAYALGKAPEHLTERQQIKIEMNALEHPVLYRVYLLREQLRLLLKIRDLKEAEAELNHWLWKASHSRIPAIYTLQEKIRRHKNHILNTIRLGMSNARRSTTRLN